MKTNFSPAYAYLALIGVALTVFFWLMQEEVYRYPLNARATYARDNLHQLLLGLEMYHDKHGVLPYHPEGSDHALFLLRDLLDPSCLAFDAVNDPTKKPAWDVRGERARNCAWEYLNEKDVRVFDPNQIVIMSKPVNGWKTVFVGQKYLLIRMLEFEEYPGRALLGARVMVDGSIHKPGTASWVKNPGGSPESSPESRMYRKFGVESVRTGNDSHR
jgi:hypothetical protein